MPKSRIELLEKFVGMAVAEGTVEGWFIWMSGDGPLLAAEEGEQLEDTYFRWLDRADDQVRGILDDYDEAALSG